MSKAFEAQFQRSGPASPRPERESAPVDAASALKRFTEGGEKADTMSGKEMYAIVDMLKREHGAEAAALEASLLKVKRQLDKKIMLLDWVGEHVSPAAAVEKPRRASLADCTNTAPPAAEAAAPLPTAYAPLGRERGSRSSASVPSSIAGLLIAAGLLLLLNSAAFPSTAAAAAADDDFDQRLQALERVLHIDSVAGGEGDVADATCHARANTGYAGDGALVWGLGKPGFHLAGASECCTACQAHARICGGAGSEGKEWWPAEANGTASARKHGRRPAMLCGGGQRRACQIWTFCPSPRCFAFDIHVHEFGECWLKFQAERLPEAPKDPHFGHSTYPERMRQAPRRDWPWAVSMDVWPDAMPREVPWVSGVLAPAGATIGWGRPDDAWRERWCQKHGPCDD